MYRRAPGVFVLALLSGPGSSASPVANAAISGHVYIDRNGNGRYDLGERGLRGVSVSNQEAVVVSDADGAYQLSGPGSTGVIFASIPDGYTSRGTFYKSIDSSAS